MRAFAGIGRACAPAVLAAVYSRAAFGMQAPPVTIDEGELLSVRHWIREGRAFSSFRTVRAKAPRSGTL